MKVNSASVLPPLPLNFEDRILTTAEAAAMLSLKPGTLEKARSTGEGNYPPFVRLGGRRVGYLLSAVLKWIADNQYFSDGRRVPSPAV